MSVVENLQERRDALKTEADTLLSNTEATDADITRADEAITEARALTERIAALTEADLATQRENEARAKLNIPEQHPPAVVKSEPHVYGDNRSSYWLDLARDQLNHHMAPEARERLARHAKEIEVHTPELVKRGVGDMFELRVNPNRTDGQGGYFVPPLWNIDAFIQLPRGGRPFADSVVHDDLPVGTDSINIPKVATGTATAIQLADAGAVASTDLTDTFVTAPVRTIAGQQDIAMQLLDQSPVAFDKVITKDLMRDYATRVDVQALSGTGSSGQVTGLDNTGSIITQTFTSGSPTVALLYPLVMGAVSQIATNLLDAATNVTVFMHPRRWYWMLGALDSSNRPLVVPNPAFGQSLNPLGAGSSQAAAQGPIGWFGGIPVTLDPNIATNLGAGTNQDNIYVVATEQIYLWEGKLRTRALQEILSGTLQVRLQVFNYLAFMANRLPKAIAIISGTGLVAPAGY